MCDFQPSKWLVAAVIALYIAVIVGLPAFILHLHIQGSMPLSADSILKS